LRGGITFYQNGFETEQGIQAGHYHQAHFYSVWVAAERLFPFAITIPHLVSAVE